MRAELYQPRHDRLLERYFAHPDTPPNNSSHAQLKTHLYDGINGMLALFIDDDEIIGMSSAMIVSEHGMTSVKYPHRLHVRSDYTHMSNILMNKYWEPLLFDWLGGIDNAHLYCTFNEDNIKSLQWSAVKHRRRTRNSYVDEFGRSVIRRNWFVLDVMIKEMNRHQFVMYTSPNDIWFYPWRDMRVIPASMRIWLNSRFVYKPGSGWLL